MADDDHRKGNEEGRRSCRLARRLVFPAITVALLIAFPHAEVDAATCCVNSTSGQDFDSCVCLADNSQIAGYNLTRGESGLFHWVLGSSNSELITLVPRGNLSFKLSPCYGSARMDVMSASPSSWSYLPSFSSEDDLNPVTLTISVLASEYAVFVTAGEISNYTTFDLATFNTLRQTPAPGGSGLLTPTMPTSSSAAIAFQAGTGNATYRLYWSSLSTWAGGVGESPTRCVEPTHGLSLLNNSNCMFSSVCGMGRAAEGSSDWKAAADGTSQTFEAPVASGIQYIFNVAMRDSNNITFAYGAANMSFSFTTYQQCVSDPECQSQLHDDTTLISVCVAVVGVLLFLIGSTKGLRSSISSTMEKASLTSTGGAKSAFGGLRSPSFLPSKRTTGKNEGPFSKDVKPQGLKIHADIDSYSISNEGGQATPAATPAPGPTEGGFGDETVGGQEDDNPGEDWKDTSSEPRSRKVSTRLMKSPPSGTTSPTNNSDDEKNSAARGNERSRAPRRLTWRDEQSSDADRAGDRSRASQPRSRAGQGERAAPLPVAVEESNDNHPPDDPNSGSGEEDEPRFRHRKKVTDKKAGQMMTKTKTEFRGTAGGGAGSRSRRPQRRRVRRDEDENSGDDSM